MVIRDDTRAASRILSITVRSVSKENKQNSGVDIHLIITKKSPCLNMMAIFASFIPVIFYFYNNIVGCRVPVNLHCFTKPIAVEKFDDVFELYIF